VLQIHYKREMRSLFRRDFDAAALVRSHPPILRHPHKRLVYELCGGAATTGSIAVTRWRAEPLPPTLELAATEIVAMPGHYDYAGQDAGVWHVNFADPQLFVAYGSALLAQDELQAAEHPALGSIREALLAEAQPALTEQDGAPTPVLVAGVERRCAIATAPDLAAGRPYGLYGNRFAASPADLVRGAVRVLHPPARSNLISIAAPTGWGDYTRPQLEHILVTAFTGFAAATTETARLWPGTAIEIRTGFWGCGAFGGNRHVMTALQLLAARLAGVARLRFYAFDDAGRADFTNGAGVLARIVEPGGTVADAIERLADLDYAWGTSDGN
jgi:Poly (ADP-ribose) glycohydrolase (PARG), Macro domain fold